MDFSFRLKISTTLKKPKNMSFIMALFFSTMSYSQTYLNIDVNQAKDTIEANLENEAFTILDVRTPSEYIPEHIEGAYNRDFYDDDFDLQLDSLDKDRIYLIYCRSGNRSGQALKIMENLEFNTVYNMLGGMNDWNAQGFSTTDELPVFNPDLYMDRTTSVSELTIKNIHISPNPTQGIIDLEISSNVISKVFSLDGRMVFKKESEQSDDLDISFLKNGTYILSAESIDGVLYLGKIVKL